MPSGEADRWSHARPLPDPCVGCARAASTGAALAAGSSLLGDSQDARSHHRAPGLQPGGGASRLHRLPAIPDAQLAAAFRQCDGRDRAGSPEATRRLVNKAFLEALAEDFRKGGPQAIAKVRKYHPAAYMKICAMREMKLEHSG